MTKDEIIHDLVDGINREGATVVVWYVGRGEDGEKNRKVVLNESVAWVAKYKNGVLAFFATNSEKPIFGKAKGVETDFDGDVVIVDAGETRFQFMPLSDDEERELRDFWKDEADPSNIEDELEGVTS